MTAPLPPASRLPCGAWVYALGGRVSSVNARHARPRPAAATLLAEVHALAPDQPVALAPALGRVDEHDALYVARPEAPPCAG